MNSYYETALDLRELKLRRKIIQKNVLLLSHGDINAQNIFLFCFCLKAKIRH